MYIKHFDFYRWWSKRHPTAPQATVLCVQLHPSFQQFNRQNLQNNRTRILLWRKRIPSRGSWWFLSHSVTTRLALHIRRTLLAVYIFTFLLVYIEKAHMICENVHFVFIFSYNFVVINTNEWYTSCVGAIFN